MDFENATVPVADSPGISSSLSENGPPIYENATLPVADVTVGPSPYVLPVYGLPGPIFIVLHVQALISLVTSLLMTFLVLFFIFKDLKPKSGIWRRPIGERLVFYLAVCDVCYCFSHILDHSYMLVTSYFPPDDLCR